MEFLEGLEPLLNLVVELGFPGIFLFLVKRHYAKKDKLLEQEQEKRINREQRMFDERIQWNQHCEEFSELVKKVDQIAADSEVQKLLVNSSTDLLRDRMLSAYRKYQSNNNSMSLHEKENFSHMYADYKALGGNGMIDAIYEEVMH